jgi:hypothetical protein
MDYFRKTLPSGIDVSIILNGDRDEDGNMVCPHEMLVVFRKVYRRHGFKPRGCLWCPIAHRRRMYRIAPERWQYVNEKYCDGLLSPL